MMLAFVRPALLAGPETLNDRVLAGYNAGQIDADLARPNASAGGVTGIVGHLRGGDHGLRRRATRINAGAAQVFLLDQGHAPPKVGQLVREGAAALTRTDHDRVVCH